MSKLYTKFSVAVVSLLCSQAYIHTMEPESRMIPSLRDMCVKYISEHIDEVNALSHLSSMPVELASDIIRNMQGSVIGAYKDVLISCVKKKELDYTVLSDIAYRLSIFKTDLNKQMDAALAEIMDITAALKNGTSDMVILIESNNKVSNCPSEKFLSPLKKELTDFIKLAIKTHNNKCENGNSDDHQALLQELSMQTDICIKQINALKRYASTISIPNLAHDIAKSGPLSLRLSSQIYEDFLNADIPDSFDDLYNLYFPEIIVNNDNYRFFYSLVLMHNFYLPVKIVGQFSAEEFEKQLRATIKITKWPCIEIAYNTNKEDNCTLFMSCITPSVTIIDAIFNPKQNISLIYLKEDKEIYGEIIITNTKTMMSFHIFGLPTDVIKQIGLNEDFTQLGILYKNDSIKAYIVPGELVTFSPSLEQRAFLAYMQRKTFGVLPMALPDPLSYKTVASLIKDRIKKNISLKANELKKICEFAKENKGLISITLAQALFNYRIQELEKVHKAIMTLVKVAKYLNLTVEELCDKVISEEITSSAFMDYLIAAL